MNLYPSERPKLVKLVSISRISLILRFIFRFTFCFTLVLPIMLLIGCAEDISTGQSQVNSEKALSWSAPQSGLAQRNFNILDAQWSPLSNTLNVSGTSNNNSERIKITNAYTGEAIASTISSTNLNWFLSIKSLSNVPCRLSVISESGTLETVVINAPVNCDVGVISSTTVTIITPDAVINSPDTDLSITTNQTVNFVGSASNITGTARFKWKFGGVAQGSTVQNPGEIKFTKPGVYHITLDVSNGQGLSDPSPAMRMITVFDPLTTLTAQPIANIDTPMGDQNIMVGTTLNFTGSGSDPASNEVVSFLWNFDGAMPNNAMQNPGDITFNTAGMFTIVLSVSDAAGNIGTSQVVITVTDPGANQAPTGMISSPPGDVMINTGGTVLVEGSAMDPDGNVPMTYLWEFDGVIANSMMQNPGEIIYPNPGIYTLRLIVTDSLGLADMSPPVRIITVQDTAPPVTGDFPVGEILTPNMDVTIAPGESVNFTATGTAAAGKAPLSFLWMFDGVAPNSAAMDAGPITFPDVGMFTVTLLAIDATGQSDPTPAVRVITVQMPGTPPVDMPPMIPMVGHIVTPEVDVTIAPGDAVNFSGMVNPMINPPYTYLWLFDGASSNSSVMSPGDVVFGEPGSYSVMFFAIDKDGVFDSRPAMRTITTSDPIASPLSPITRIVMPTGDLMINVGDVVTFEGSVIDVSGNGTLNYLWTFGGAAPDDTALTPTPVTFSVAGTYEVTFSALDTTTMLNTSQPAIITITVNDIASITPNAPDVSIISPAQNTIINAGESVDFEGMAIDNTGNGMLVYLWTFEGVAPDNDTLTPGTVMFDMAGEYDVVFTVIDTSDVTGLTAATTNVSIIVLPLPVGPGPVPASLPDSFIVEPDGMQTITVGETIFFTGDGINPVNNGQLKYEWDFGNGLSSTEKVPGMVTFNQVGSFTVTLTARQSAVHVDPTPAQVIINVVPF